MKIDKTNLIGVSSLLVHAAKIDENYTENEKKLIEKFISTISEENLDPISLLKEAEKTESNSNQLLQFTQIVKKNSEEQKTIVEKIMAEFSITHLRDVKATALSGGERRKLAIGMAIINDPKILLLDEPYAALDILSIKMIQEIIVNLQ